MRCGTETESEEIGGGKRRDEGTSSGEGVGIGVRRIVEVGRLVRTRWSELM